ncbi:hypothetical protein BKA69DRAFT_364733 [Paraphysoderma sedebokerense]|nr:hypothetical protein BKA69DRAFT_364733 [Paraphysoderma sedebokerense]
MPFESFSNLSSIQECTALNKYVKEGTGLESTMPLPLQIHQLLHYYVYPTQSLPASLEKTLPTLLSKSIETLKEAERTEVEWYMGVEAEWKKSFRSLYLSLRNNLIPYFYYTHQQEFSILFIASHISKSKRIEAVVTKSTTGLRRRLEMEGLSMKQTYLLTSNLRDIFLTICKSYPGIEFEMPLADKLKPKVIPKNYVVADEDSDLQSEAETDDDDDENKMKEGRKDQALRIPNHQPELLDNLPASLLVIMGTLNVNSLFKFLLGYGSGTVSAANSSSQKDFGLGENRIESKFQSKGRNQKTATAGALKNRGIKYGNIQLPRLISPGVFEGAGVKKCEITRNGPIQRSSKSSTETLYRFQIQGYILPHALYHLKRILFSFAKCGVLEGRTQKIDNQDENKIQKGNKENSLGDRTSNGPVMIRDENVLEVSTKLDEETVVALERCVDVELWG